ncbi:protein of unknown function [Halopseudomonas litoralis]|uniref:DUF4823 domain-containing protein n=1 Tax=Halopseudomonas litoralis TaxID=797277 RepID=A0A1H1RM24_9GAMM|nr:DUF4823 domain-containing protein [Halopseudomonas litoralis]SDS36801.1 protein of unknown function [Halopseudomonas litoralis]
MKMTIGLSRITAVLALASLAVGCTPSQMKEEGRFYLSDAGLLDRYQISRSGNFRLQADSRLYIAQSHFVPVGHAYARPNILAEEGFAAAVQVFPMVRRAEQPLGLDEALARTRQQGLDYLLYTRFASAQSSASAQQTAQQASDGDVGRDQVVLQLMLLEASTERVIDFATINSRTGFLAFYKSRPEDLLREPMEDYTRQLLGSR